MNLDQLNLHHLRYFWAVAKTGNLTRTAAQLRVAQSAISTQIQLLEQQLGHALFRRAGRQLVLTEEGTIAFTYADAIFATTEELLSTLSRGRGRHDQLRVGAVATLSRNFQESFITPLLALPDARVSIESGALDDLLVRLAALSLDVVLANRRPDPGRFRCRRVARQPVSIVGTPGRKPFAFPAGIDGVRMIAPGPANTIRSEFDALCEQRGVRPRIVAEVDDMAMMRLLARDTQSLALLPSVVVRDELRDRVLQEYCEVPGIFETFYAITVARTFPHPLLTMLTRRDEDELLSAHARARPRS